VRRPLALISLLAAVAGLQLSTVGSAAGLPEELEPKGKDVPVPLSGAAEFGDRDFGTFITECPQAGLAGKDREDPLDRREIDRVERISERGDDVRTNTDYSCMAQNETSVAINPLHPNNLTSGQNDYRTRSRQGFNSSTDGGRSWYSAELPPPSVPNGDIIDASGDPVYVFDRDGVAYASSITFNRTDDENGIMVQRSTNGGYTWTRPCVPVDLTPTDPSDQSFACGDPAPVGDPRQPGDNVVTYFDDPDNTLNGSQPFDDKEWLTAGPRPAGVPPQCFTVQHTPRPCDPVVVGVDRLYVTWTRFDVAAEIMISFSDDQARSWSPARAISGSAPFCIGGAAPGACDVNQFSVPTVHPRTGLLGVAFENFNTPDENQYLFVRSMDGSATFQGPFFVTSVFDVNYPVASVAGGRPDCVDRSQQVGRQVLTNSCFRVNAGGNVVVDKRGASMAGGFGDDFYLIMSDNRNGTRSSSNTDVFFFKSTNGGSTWIGPTRVNNDTSSPPANRDCGFPGEPACPPGVHTGNDQWFPWMDISNRGTLAAGFHDRRLDTDSTASEWPASRQRAGNYLAWFWGAGCEITKTAEVTGSTIPADARQCLAPGASVIPQPTAPVDPGADPVPGQGPSFLGPFRNQVVSDVPHNLDYSFRAGIFMGDYNAVAYPNLPGSTSARGDDRDKRSLAIGFWTDARNGRGSGNPDNPDTFQPGRNPQCEQSDVFLDFFDPLSTRSEDRVSEAEEDLFAVTPCPGDAMGEVDDDFDG
jgi:hypothetical protein